MSLECAREHEVVGVVLSDRWPDGCDEELRRHVARCAVCTEVSMVAGVLRHDRDLARSAVRVPAAGQVWWRAAVRMRMDAAHAAARPITWLQGLAAACAAGLVCAALGFAWPSVREASGRLLSLSPRVEPDAAQLFDLFALAVRWSGPLLLACGVCALLAPIALYFVLVDD
jgi:hypothetical protein